MVRLLFSCLRQYVIAVMLLFAFLFIVGVLVAYLQPHDLIAYVATVIVPTLLAMTLVTSTIVRSGYWRLVLNYGLKRRISNRAGLALLKSDTNKVLLAAQKEPPWVGMYLLPGGYFNKDKGDMSPIDTARRRLVELCQLTISIQAGPTVAETKNNHRYISEMLEFGHVPTHDSVYLMHKDGTDVFKESDVIETNDVRWVSVDMIKAQYKVPPHMAELILFVLEGTTNALSTLEYWQISDEWSNFYLQKEFS